MPRPKTDLKSYAVFLTPADADAAMRLAAALGLLSERGEPSRSAAIRHLIRAFARREAEKPTRAVQRKVERESARRREKPEKSQESAV